MKNKKEAFKLLEKIDKILLLGEKGLARVEEVSEIEILLKNFLKDSLDSDSEIGRRFEKWQKVSRWKIIPRDGFAVRSHFAPLEGLRNFLTEYLEEENIQPQPTQKLVKKGEVYTGRKVLREIIGKAKNTIDIQDNYINVETLSILEPYVGANEKLKVRLTTDKIEPPFKSDLSLFFQQFGRITVKVHKEAHGRFIILDEGRVYHLGHSLKDFGKKTDMISEVIETKAKNDTIRNFEDWWEKGKTVEINV